MRACPTLDFERTARLCLVIQFYASQKSRLYVGFNVVEINKIKHITPPNYALQAVIFALKLFDSHFSVILLYLWQRGKCVAVMKSDPALRAIIYRICI